MSIERFSNNAATTLGSNISSGATTITVATGTGGEFPTISGAQWFSATLWAAGSTTGTPNEVVYVTARTGDTMTVLRGQEGTTAQAWSIGDTFANYPTAAFLNSLATSPDVQQQAGNSAVDTGTASAGIITLAPIPASMAALLYTPIRVLKTNAANTGAYTLNINGLGAQPVTFGGNALRASALVASQIFEVVWDGTSFELLSTPATVPTQALFDASNQFATDAFVQAALGNFAGLSQYNSNTTLTTADVGKATIIGGSGPVTIILPAANAVPAGKAINCFTQGAVVTVNRAGADTINIGPTAAVTSFTISGADFFTATSNGSSGWTITNGAPMFQNEQQGGIFGALLASPGFQMLPSGLIIQFGTGTSVGTSVNNVSVNFAKAFPNACLGTIAFVTGTTAGNYVVTGSTFSTTNAQFCAMLNGAYTNGIGIFYVAFGK